MKRTHLGLAVLGLAVAASSASAAALKPGVYVSSSSATTSTCSNIVVGTTSNGYIDLAAVGAAGSTDTVPNLLGGGTAEYVVISTPAGKGINGIKAGEAYVEALNTTGGLNTIDAGPVKALFKSTAVDANTAFGTQQISIIDPSTGKPCSATLAQTLVRVGE